MPKDFPYSRQFEPPAPVVEITLRARGEHTLQVLIDTGADASMLPIAALRAVNARSLKSTGLFLSLDVLILSIYMPWIFIWPAFRFQPSRLWHLRETTNRSSGAMSSIT